MAQPRLAVGDFVDLLGIERCAAGQNMLHAPVDREKKAADASSRAERMVGNAEPASPHVDLIIIRMARPGA